MRLTLPENTDDSICCEELCNAVETWEEALAEGPDDSGDISLPFDVDLYHTLKPVATAIEDYNGARNGEYLIRESHFTEYIQDLVNECYDVPGKKFDMDKWPWSHLNMDWESCAEEAKQDYVEVDFDGVTYYLRYS